MPLTKLLPPKLAVKQFKQTFDWGGQYLLTSSRALGASLLITGILTSQLSDAVEAEKWKVWAGSFCFLILVAPYEIYFIFPINDRADEIGLELERGGVTEKKEGELKKELRVLLGMWQRRNFGRVGMPLVTGVVALAGVVRRG